MVKFCATRGILLFNGFEHNIRKVNWSKFSRNLFPGLRNAKCLLHKIEYSASKILGKKSITLLVICGISSGSLYVHKHYKPFSRIMNCADHCQIAIDKSVNLQRLKEKSGDGSRLVWLLRCLSRAVQLFATFTPLFLLYCVLIVSGNERLQQMWWQLLLNVVKSNGPCIIKLSQWLSTRRDLFSRDFCDCLAKLQHCGVSENWPETETVLDEAFGLRSHWSAIFSCFEPIGSGCIAQVYKAALDPVAFKQFTGVDLGIEPVSVAIKVGHGSVLRQVQMDLGIVRWTARLAQFVAPSLKLVDPVECVRQFQSVLERQVDLRHEAQALHRFNVNFAQSSQKQENGGSVRFPLPICYTHDLLVETFETGVHVGNLLTNDIHDIDMKLKSPEIKHKIALTGARALLKMIFVDNFVHGDLHPGNVLIRLNERSGGAIPYLNLYSRLIDYLISHLPFIQSKTRLGLFESQEASSISTSSGSYSADPTLIFLDTGITVEQTDEHMRNFRAVFRAIVQDQGELAGDLILEHSRFDNCNDRLGFRREMGQLVHRAVVSGTDMNGLNIGELLTGLFGTVRRHGVALDPSFTCIVLAVMVLEGLGRSLDPKLDIFACARPYLLSIVH